MNNKSGLKCQCGEYVSYSFQWDSYYCEKCEMWTEDACGCKEECEFKNRPEKPVILRKEDNL